MGKACSSVGCSGSEVGAAGFQQASRKAEACPGPDAWAENSKPHFWPQNLSELTVVELSFPSQPLSLNRAPFSGRHNTHTCPYYYFFFFGPASDLKPPAGHKAPVIICFHLQVERFGCCCRDEPRSPSPAAAGPQLDTALQKKKTNKPPPHAQTQSTKNHSPLSHRFAETRGWQPRGLRSPRGK